MYTNKSPKELEQSLISILSQAYDLGKSAGLNGAEIDDCPFADNVLRLQWRWGWLSGSAQRLDRDQRNRRED